MFIRKKEARKETKREAKPCRVLKPTQFLLDTATKYYLLFFPYLYRKTLFDFYFFTKK